MPYLKGEDPSLEERVERLGFLERHLPPVVAARLAHHRYALFVPPSEAGPASLGEATTRV